VVGVGGTGVLTVSQVLQMAVMLDGHHSNGLGQTGLSQKAGPVVSDLYLTTKRVEEGVTFPSGKADLLLGCDILTSASPSNLRVADPERTIAIVSDTVVPTGRMVVDVNAPVPDAASARAAIDAATRSDQNLYLDAQLIAERLLGDTTPTNVIVLGAAWQRGLLPVTLESLEEAFRLNGAAVERNLAALAWGRACVVAPDDVAAALNGGPAAAEPSERARALARKVDAEDGSELRRLLQVRIDDLIGWGGRRAAQQYVETVARVRAAEAEHVPDSTALTESVARGLHKLTAYKDEYEVARLHVEGLANLPDGTKFAIHLHPPLLREMGMKRKLKFGRWFVPVLRLLRRGWRLRGTALDPFGRTEVRRVERALPGEYMELVDRALARLTPETLPLALEVAELPELVRGYEQIKLAGVGRFRARGAELRTELQST
jgi:indolepyruvate ferredoxin oxidoreductase